MKMLSNVGQRMFAQLFSWALFLAVAATLAGLCVDDSDAAENAANLCAKTSRDVLASCRSEAESDFLLANARCDNLSAAEQRNACRQEAAAEEEDELMSCKEQFDVRQSACESLGPGPYDPAIDPANFVDTIDNPYFPLTPGTTYVYEGQTSQGLERDEFAVTKKTRVIMGVKCVEVRDTVRVDGKVTEDTFDWFAQDIDGNVWYFGENTHELESGLISSIDGTFMSGVNGAKPGIIMKAHPVVGNFYRQEFDLGNAEDFAEVTGLNSSINVPVGKFHRCLKTKETTPLEPDLLEDKYYCRGVGNVLVVDEVTGERSELIEIR